MEEWMDPHMIFTSEFLSPVGLVDMGSPEHVPAGEIIVVQTKRPHTALS